MHAGRKGNPASLRARVVSMPAGTDGDPERALAGIQEDIMLGRLGPRARLTEDEVMERFGLKRHVAREVLARLSRMGIVVKEPNRGAVVRSFSPEEVEHIYHMRTLLQREAARLIPLPPPAELLRRLRRLQQAHAAAVERRELLKVFYLNNEFHETLFAACGNPWLCESVRQFSWMAYAIRCYRIADPDFQIQARDEHAQMIDAMEAGDRKRLMTLCVEHIMRSKVVYLEDQRRLA